MSSEMMKQSGPRWGFWRIERRWSEKCNGKNLLLASLPYIHAVPVELIHSPLQHQAEGRWSLILACLLNNAKDDYTGELTYPRP